MVRCVPRCSDGVLRVKGRMFILLTSILRPKKGCFVLVVLVHDDSGRQIGV